MHIYSFDLIVWVSNEELTRKYWVSDDFIKWHKERINALVEDMTIPEEEIWKLTDELDSSYQLL